MQGWVMHPGKQEKQVITVVSCGCEMGSCTPEVGKSKSSRGEMLMQGWVMHPGKQEKQVITVVSCRREIRRCTLEKGKASHYSGESPPRD